MRIIADLHLHSKYSRACSKDLDLEHNDQWARLKGITVVGTADFTHPRWLAELKEKLVEDKPGLFKLNGSDGNVLFLITTEVSCIYSQGGKVRRIHLCLFAPDFSTVEKINSALLKRGVNLSSDGRPIMGLPAEEVAKIVLDANEHALVIPAHAWTPWFSVFGSNSGFDSLEECFGSMTKHIYAIETGLSSDPPMNWRLSALDHITLLSNSDAHSPPNLGREANVFEIPEDELSYDEIRRVIQEKDATRFSYTVEFFPQEGKYHWDGHRACDFVCSPAETKKQRSICPRCKKPLTVGVDYRVDRLADREVGSATGSIAYRSVVPLQELIAEAFDQGKNTKKVAEAYQHMVGTGNSEFQILLDLDEASLRLIAEPAVAQAIMNVRKGRVVATPGYDGVYGVIHALKPEERIAGRQKSLL